MNNDFASQTVGLEEAAEFLGLKSKERLRQLIKRGIVPGFKVGKRWMCRKQKLVEYVEQLENALRNMAQVDMQSGVNVCQLAKRKIHPIGTRDSLSVELGYRNQLSALIAQRPRNMKKNADAK